MDTTINVADPGLVEAMEVHVGVVHPELADITVTLISPAGTEVLLHNRAPAGADLNVTYPTERAAVAGPRSSSASQRPARGGFT